jgi:tetratricopeptide (TPR) repeat protein
MGQMYVFYIFAVLGLIVSGAALYGAMAVSLLSQLLVEGIMPAERSKTREPRYAPAEALERDEDYDGAIQEYMVIARLFPRDPTALLRIADLYMKLMQPEDAANWFERALPHLDSAEESLEVTNRLSEIYQRHLERPADAARLLDAYLKRYPGAPYAPSVEERLRRLNAPV